MDICCVFNFIIFVSVGHYDLIGRPWRQKDLAQPQNPKHTHFVILRLSLIVLRTNTKETYGCLHALRVSLLTLESFFYSFTKFGVSCLPLQATPKPNFCFLR